MEEGHLFNQKQSTTEKRVLLANVHGLAFFGTWFVDRFRSYIGLDIVVQVHLSTDTSSEHMEAFASAEVL